MDEQSEQDTNVDERMLKLARMIEQGVSEPELASIFGIAPEKLSAVLASPAYLQAAGTAVDEQFEKQQTLNKGWDGIEEFAMVTVLEQLQGPTPDPDYALRAASVANKAIRRGKTANQPIAVQPNLQSVIQLNATYVGQLNQSFHVSPRAIADVAKKQTNLLSVKGVKSLLGISKEVQGEVEPALTDLNGVDFGGA